MKVKFPNFLKPYYLNKDQLVRVGSVDEGGYVVPLLNIKDSKNIDETISDSDGEPPTEDTNEDQFVEFFSVVNDLLGSMHDDFVNSFVASDDFSLFQAVGESPDQTSEEAREEFFSMINRVLGDLPDDKINEFVQSPGFTTFQSMGEIYGN